MFHTGRFVIPLSISVLALSNSSADAQTIYFTDFTGHEVNRAGLDGSRSVTLIPAVLKDPRGIAVDLTAAKIYWTDAEIGTVTRANSDGTGIETIVDTLDNPTGVALDVNNGVVYWTTHDDIQRYALDGAAVETVVADLEFASAIAVDSMVGRLYWSDVDPDTGDGRIRAAGLNGNDVQDIVSTGGTPPASIALDLAAGMIYWIHDSGIHRTELDGASVETIDTGLTIPGAMTLDAVAGKLYWTDTDTGDIWRANLDGTLPEAIVSFALDSPLGMALDASLGKLYWVDNGTDRIQRANPDGSDIEDVVQNTVQVPRGVALDVGAGKMYWADYQGAIQRANLDGSGVEDLVTGDVGYRCVRLDTAPGKMYWTHDDSRSIHRADLDGSNVEDLITSDLTAPANLAIDSAAQKLYWVDGRGGGPWKIQRANLDGSQIEDLVTAGMVQPGGLVMDIPAGKLWWPDITRFVNQDATRIMRANLDGTDVGEIFSVAGGRRAPRDIAIDPHSGRIYWSESNQGYVASINPDGTDFQAFSGAGQPRPWGIAIDARELVSAFLDIAPKSCPNPLYVGGYGVVQVAVAGTGDFPVSQIDPANLFLSRVDAVSGATGVPTGGRAISFIIADVTTPFDGDLCGCHAAGGDGIDDLVLKFSTPEFTDALQLGGQSFGANVEVALRGYLRDGRSFSASDCVAIVKFASSFPHRRVDAPGKKQDHGHRP